MSHFAATVCIAVMLIEAIVLPLAFLRGFAQGRRLGHREARQAAAVKVITAGPHGARSLDALIRVPE